MNQALKTKRARKLTHITGKRWFQKSYGNTYHSATLHFDDGTQEYSGKHYGYGEGFLQTAVEMAHNLGVLADPGRHDNGSYKSPMWQQLKDASVTYSVSDVARERDL